MDLRGEGNAQIERSVSQDETNISDQVLELHLFKLPIDAI